MEDLENSDLKRYLEKGIQKLDKNSSISINEYIEKDMDFFIYTDLIFDKLADEIGGLNHKELTIRKSKWELVELKMNEGLHDPFNKDIVKNRFKYYLSKVLTLKYYIDFALTKNKSHNRKEKKNSIENLEQIFKDEYKELIDQFLEILKNEKNMEGGLKPLINTTNEWIGNQQAAMVFYNVLLREGVINKIGTRKLGLIFEGTFMGLNKSFSSNTPGFSAKDYEGYFQTQIQRIKNKK